MGKSKKCAVSNTGPMISVFQSDQVELLKSLYDRIYIPNSALPEYTKHGAEALIKELIGVGYMAVCELSGTEKEAAKQISEEIANHPLTMDRIPQNHYAEAEAMVLMNRPELQALEILLDEQAAREVARKHGLSVIGFAGVLVRACKEGRITPEAVRDILCKCRSLGTHYAKEFIKSIYARLKEEL
jgi:predicted nucleic acid-binding protein